MAKIWCLRVTSCLVTLLLSCGHPRVDEFEASLGQIAQDDTICRFGYPQRLKKLPTGTEVWDYEFLAGNSRCVGYRVYFDEDRRSQRWEPRDCRQELTSPTDLTLGCFFQDHAYSHCLQIGASAALDSLPLHRC